MSPTRPVGVYFGHHYFSITHDRFLSNTVHSVCRSLPFLILDKTCNGDLGKVPIARQIGVEDALSRNDRVALTLAFCVIVAPASPIRSIAVRRIPRGSASIPTCLLMRCGGNAYLNCE
jgi:hypothetical protein